MEVREIQKSEMVRQPTAAQLADLRMIAEGADEHDHPELSKAVDRLGKDLLLAKNVGLADAAVALLAEQVAKSPTDLPQSAGELWSALSRRAVERHYTARRSPSVQLAIRGDYVRPLAELEMKVLKAWYQLTPDEPEPRRARPRVSIEVLLALCLDSKDEPLRKPLAELAKANAKLPDPLSWARDPALIHYHHGRLGLAWHVLQDLDVLQGMSEAEVTAILGRPTRRYQNVLEWYAASSMHVNPFIRAFLADGKVQSVTSGV